MIPAKIARALHGIGMADPGEPDEPTDHDGSAKVALIAIERSVAAWQQIASKDPSSTTAAAIEELNWLEREVDRTFPKAKDVRPARVRRTRRSRSTAERTIMGDARAHASGRPRRLSHLATGEPR
jgi:hypothetical protein